MSLKHHIAIAAIPIAPWLFQIFAIPFARYPYLFSTPLFLWSMLLPVALLTIWIPLLAILWEECSSAAIGRLRFVNWICLPLNLALVISQSLTFLHLTQTDFNGYPLTETVPFASETISNAERVSKKIHPRQNPIFALISDTHITTHTSTLEGQRYGNEKFLRTLSKITQVQPRMCVVSGDLTDQGDSEEWTLFKNLLNSPLGMHQPRNLQILVLPGNHDLQGSPFRLGRGYGYNDQHEDQLAYLRRATSFFQLARSEARLLHSMTNIELQNIDFDLKSGELFREASRAKWLAVPTRTKVGSGEPIYFKIYPPGFNDKLNNTITDFDAIFPLFYEDKAIGLAIVELNSSAIVRSGNLMGLGDIGLAQQQRLESYLELLRSKDSLKVLLIVLHHAPLRRETDQWSWSDAFQEKQNSDIYAHTFLAMNKSDALTLVSSLDRFAERRRDVHVVIAHGHRHGQPYLGRTMQGVWILEAPAVVEVPINDAGFWGVYLEKKELKFLWLS